MPFKTTKKLNMTHGWRDCCYPFPSWDMMEGSGTDSVTSRRNLGRLVSTGELEGPSAHQM